MSQAPIYSARYGRRCVVIALLVTLFCAATQSGHAENRIAIWSEGEAAIAIAELLTGELSATTNLAMLERTELDRIAREQELTLTFGRDALSASRMMGADGLIVLQPRDAFLQIDMYAVQPGILISQQQVPNKSELFEETTRRLAAHIQTQIPRLRISAESAIPISIAGIKTISADPNTPNLASTIKRLFMHRLSINPRIFLLDRERMNLLAREKLMDHRAEMPFWKSGYVIDILINPTGRIPNQVTLELHISKSDQTGQRVQVNGPTDNLPELIESAVGLLLPHFSKSPTETRTWDPLAEAEIHYEEAIWAQRWGLTDRALESIDAAWALGLRREVCPNLRAQMHVQKIGIPRLELETTDPGRRLRPLPIPAEDAFDATQLAFDAAEDYLRAYPLRGDPGYGGWVDANLAVLERASVLLKLAYADINRRDWNAEHKRRVELLRARSRQNAALFERSVFNTKSQMPVADRHADAKPVTAEAALDRLNDIAMEYAPLWFDQPVQAAPYLAAVYKRYRTRVQAATSDSPKAYDIFFRSYHLPWAPNWNFLPEDTFAPIAREAYRQIIDPDDPLSFLHSSLLELRAVRRPEDIREAVQRYSQALALNMASIEPFMYGNPLPQLRWEIDRKWSPLTIPLKSVRTESERVFARLLLPAYLQHSKYQHDSIKLILTPDAVSAVGVDAVQPLWIEYKKRVAMDPAKAEKYEAALGWQPEPQSSASIKNKDVTSNISTASITTTKTTTIPSKEDEDFLLIPRLPIRAQDPLTDEFYPVSIESFIAKDDSLWISGHFTVTMPSIVNRTMKVLVHVDTHTQEIRSTVAWNKNTYDELLAAQGSLAYVGVKTNVVEWNHRTGQRRTLALPYSAGMQLWANPSGLFSFADQTLSRYDDSSQSFAILSSGKRKPGRNILDDRPPYTISTLAEHENTVWVWIGSTGYRYKPDTGQWEECYSVPGKRNVTFLPDGVLTYSSTQGANFDFFSYQSATQRSLLALATSGTDSAWITPDHDSFSATTRKNSPTRPVTVSNQELRLATLDKGSLWVLTWTSGQPGPELGPPVHQFAKTSNRTNTIELWHFSPTNQRAEGCVHIRLEGEPISKPEDYSPWPIQLIASEQAIYFVSRGGVWRQSKEALRQFIIRPAKPQPPARLPAPVVSATQVEPTESIFVGMKESLARSRREFSRGVESWKDRFSSKQKERTTPPQPPKSRQYSRPPPRPTVTIAPFKAWDEQEALLWKAFQQEDLATLQRLLREGTSPNAPDQRGRTLIMMAAARGDSASFESLLAAGGTIDAFDHEGKSALIHAAGGGHTGIVHTLIQRGGSINGTDINRTSPLLWAIANRQLSVVGKLLELGADANQTPDFWSMMDTPLIEAIRSDDIRFVELLLEKGADPNQIGRFGTTPLIAAALDSDGNDNIVRLLLNRKANVRSTDESGHTALHYAIRENTPNIVALLVDAGTPLDTGEVSRRSYWEAAALNGNLDIGRILIEKGIAHDEATLTTTLLTAIQANRAEFAKFLIEQGANIDSLIESIRTHPNASIRALGKGTENQ